MLDEVGNTLVNEFRVVRPHSGARDVLAVLAKRDSIRWAALTVIDAIDAIAGRGATVVGEGASGLIATEMAKLAPWVERLVLVDTPLTEEAFRWPTGNAAWHIRRRRWSGACRKFLRESDPLIDRLRGLDRPTLVVENEMSLFDSPRQPGPGGRIRFTSARDSEQLAAAIASFANPSRRRRSQRFQRDSRRQQTPIAV
jgi:pimeloyl-ACP methyl ester carboxylesterase